MIRPRSIWIFALGALLGLPSVTHAKLIHWDLYNVVFTDGGTLTGFFVMNPDIPSPNSQLVDFRILASGGDEARFSPFLYTPDTTGINGAFGGQPAAGTGALVLNAKTSPSRTMQMEFNTLPSDQINLPFPDNHFPVFLTAGERLHDPTNPFLAQRGTSTPTLYGYVPATPVPEPSVILLVTLGLATLASLRRHVRGLQERKSWLREVPYGK